MEPIFFDLVQTHLRFLVDDYGFSVSYKKHCPESFGNAIVQFRSNEFLIRIVRDKGQVFVDIGPQLALDTPKWFDLMDVVSFLERDHNACQWSYVFPPDHLDPISKDDWQLNRVANILRSHWDGISCLLRGEDSRQKLRDLERFRKEREEQRLGYRL